MKRAQKAKPKAAPVPSAAPPSEALSPPFGPLRLRLGLIGRATIGIAFSYDKMLVDAVKALEIRRWNSGAGRWEVHISHLEDVQRIFGLERAQVPKEIADAHAKAGRAGAIKVKLDATTATLLGEGIPATAIDEATSFFVPGYTFSHLFKTKKWDGKKHLFSRRTMSFPAGLWPRVRAILERKGIEFSLEAPPAAEARRAKFAPASSELRPYQSAALASAAEARRGIAQIATGGGKTLLAAHLIRTLGRRAVFFVHTRELLYQTADVFRRELGGEIGLLGDGCAEIQDVTVATLQTAARLFEIAVPRERSEDETEEETDAAEERATRLGERREELAAAFRLAQTIIFDECHHVPADTAYKIAFEMNCAEFRYGLSATPWRDDHHDLLLEAALGPKVCAISCSDLIRLGYLVAPKIEMEAAAPSGPRRRGVPYPEIYRRAIVENQARNRAIAARAREWAGAGRSVLILVAQVEHGKRLLELLPEAQFAHGSLPTEVRRQYLAELERKLRPVLIATTLADEGLDIPSLDALILAGGGKSATKAYQRIGRTLRPGAGKREAFVMDFYDPMPYLEDHSLARLALYRAEPAFEVCARGFQA